MNAGERDQMLSVLRSMYALLLAATLLLTKPALIGEVYAFSPANAKAVATFLLPASKNFKYALPAERVQEFASIAMKPGGAKVVGETVGKMNLHQAVVEDTFARILVAQGRVQHGEADGWMRRLSGVPGFRGAMSKSMGASEANTIGHLNEVRIADSAARSNFKVHGIGVRFNDPNKKGVTDIDVLLERNGKHVAIEAKAYPGDAAIPMDGFRADMLTLAEYRMAMAPKKVVPVFAMTNKPANPESWELLQQAAKQHEVELLVGSSDELVLQLPLLLR